MISDQRKREMAQSFIRSRPNSPRISHPPFLPLSLREGKRLGISQFDIILITGDAYVDHPSFGTSLIGRVLWEAGYTVGIISQPKWRQDDDLLALGTPRLFFGISSGNVDSMVNAYTPALKKRRGDVYSPGGIPQRPDRATIVYSERIHALFPESPLIIGGIEASLRRFAHYDYWQDRVRQSILADAPADLLVYGMGERQMLEIAARRDSGEHISSIRNVKGTVSKISLSEWRCTPQTDLVILPSYSEVSTQKRLYAHAFATHSKEQDPIKGRVVVQPHPKIVIVQNPPALPLLEQELDEIYDLPFSRRAHPTYKQPVPALAPVQFSITSHRGCFGGCAFCALTHHQGRIIQSRSTHSILNEVIRCTKMPEFKGIIHDVGGPTANMFKASCKHWAREGICRDRHCSHECKSMELDQSQHSTLLTKIRGISGIKKVFVSSGIRFDLINSDRSHSDYLSIICEHHISGHLKVAPEHISSRVTEVMNKPEREIFESFVRHFEDLQKGKRDRQYLLPYFMSGHPGCTLHHMVELACFIRDRHMYTEQVQDFTPTPMSLSTCMYYTGLNPFTLEPISVPKGRDKEIQRAMLQYRDPKNRELVEEGLIAAGREDLIGSGPRSLIRKK